MCWAAKSTRTPATELSLLSVQEHLTAWGFREGFPEEVTPALGFERWVEVQGEGFPSVCAEMGFGDF